VRKVTKKRSGMLLLEALICLLAMALASGVLLELALRQLMVLRTEQTNLREDLAAHVFLEAYRRSVDSVDRSILQQLPWLTIEPDGGLGHGEIHRMRIGTASNPVMSIICSENQIHWETASQRGTVAGILEAGRAGADEPSEGSTALTGGEIMSVQIWLVREELPRIRLGLPP